MLHFLQSSFMSCFGLLLPLLEKKYRLQVRRLGLRPTSAALVAVESVSLSLSLSSVRWKFANQLTELGIENLK